MIRSSQRKRKSQFKLKELTPVESPLVKLKEDRISV